MKKTRAITLVLITTLLWTTNVCIGAWVVTKGDRVYIEDRTGERWDVTQSQKLGFTPQRFQYGIGKDTITLLDGEDFGTKKVYGIPKGTASGGLAANILTSFYQCWNQRILNGASGWRNTLAPRS